MKRTEEKQFNLDLSNYVYTKNEFCFLGERLSLNELKLLRLCIMQIAKEDKEFFTYKITLAELARILETDKGNLSKALPKMCANLMSNLLHIQIDVESNKWKIISWCTCCSYEDGTLTIQLNNLLSPYLLELKGCFTRYPLEAIISLRNVNAIKIYELISSKIREDEVYADKTRYLSIPYEELRTVTNCKNKYVANDSMFRKRIIEPAIKDINENENNNMYIEIKKQNKDATLNETLDINIWSKTGYRVSKKEKG